MATVRQTIKQAMRWLPTLNNGAPDAEDEDRALVVLQNLIDDLGGWGGSYPYQELVVEASYSMHRDVPSLRAFVHCATGLTITLPETPRDGARLQATATLGSFASTNLTIDPNGQLFLGSSSNATISADGAWMYRADLGDWKAIADLALGDDLPFPKEFDRAIAAMLAMDLSAEAETPPVTRQVAEWARDGRDRISARYVKPLPPRHELAVRNMPSVAHQGITAEEWTDM